jgi:cytochrome b pre-mRNA-processing protein 3
MFKKIFKTNKLKVENKIYRSIVEQARQQTFYTKYGAPDTPDGRFDMITIHAFLVMRRLKDENKTTNNLSQSIFDLMFTDMEQNLREMGSGDVGVTKKIMAMAEAFYGRIKAYERGINDTSFLKEALKRNLYRETSPNEMQISSIAKYIQQEAIRLEKIEISNIMQGNLSFGTPVVLLSKNNDQNLSD